MKVYIYQWHTARIKNGQTTSIQCRLEKYDAFGLLGAHVLIGNGYKYDKFNYYYYTLVHSVLSASKRIVHLISSMVSMRQMPHQNPNTKHISVWNIVFYVLSSDSRLSSVSKIDC